MDPLRFTYERQVRMIDKSGMKILHNARPRPFVSGRVLNMSQEYPFLQGLVDTGAEHTILPNATMSYLGVKKAESTKAIIWRGQHANLQFANVTLELYNKSGYALRWRGRVGFHPGLMTKYGTIEAIPYPVFGQEGCLEFLVATFDEHRGFFTLDPSPYFPGVIRLPNSPFPA